MKKTGVRLLVLSSYLLAIGRAPVCAAEASLRQLPATIAVPLLPAASVLGQPAAFERLGPVPSAAPASAAGAADPARLPAARAQSWTPPLPAPLRSASLAGLPGLFLRFSAELERAFAEDHKGDAAAFLSDVEQGRFHAREDGLGELEAKLIDGQAAIRFASAKPQTPLVALWVNVPLAANSGLPPIRLRPASPPRIEGTDPALGSRHLDVYRSRLLVNRKLDFARLLRGEAVASPRRAVVIIDRTSDAAYSPPLRPGPRWLEHWIKGTLEGARYGDFVRGTLSAGIQFGLGYILSSAAQALRPETHPHMLAEALISGAFAWTFSVFTDSYVAFVQRGDNRFWESTKRLALSALLLSYPLALMQSGGDWASLLSLKTTALVWLVGFGDRYLSTAMNVVPKLQQKYFTKPWFFPTRLRTPFGALLARLTGKPSFAKPVKGVTWTREVLAIARFPIKFSGLLLDPVLMRWTHGIPVTSLLLWLAGALFEVLNYRAVKAMAVRNPRIAEDLRALTRRYQRIPLLRRLFQP